MEKFGAVLITSILAAAAVRLLWLPVKWGVKLLLHCGFGLVCLWLFNGIHLFPGIPINAVTVLTAGIFGLPGMAILTLLAVI